MNETLKDRITAGFAEMASMNKISEREHNLVNEKLSFLNDKVNERYSVLSQLIDALANKVSSLSKSQSNEFFEVRLCESYFPAILLFDLI